MPRGDLCQFRKRPSPTRADWASIAEMADLPVTTVSCARYSLFEQARVDDLASGMPKYLRNPRTGQLHDLFADDCLAERTFDLAAVRSSG